MIPQKRNSKHTEYRLNNEAGSGSVSELKFISDLGRNLLFAVHPKKVAAQVAEALRTGLDAELCAVAVELDHIGLVSCIFDRNGERISEIPDRKRLREWLKFMPSRVSFWEENKEDFFFESVNHKFEYVSPLHIDSEVKGAIVVGFARKNDCIKSAQNLIDAATQMTAMSLNLSSHYEAAMSFSINKTREEQQEFTESVLDALPVSLYVVDRNYRIVMWNKQRERGGQGEARDSVIGKNVFEVINNNPTKNLRAEFEKTFETGKIQHVEQQTTDEYGRIRHWVISRIPMRDELGNITHVLAIGEDITARVEATHTTGRAEKLAAVGRFTAEIVRKINKPLAAISECAESIKAHLAEGAFQRSADAEDLAEYLDLINKETFRCKSIAKGLLEFSGRRTGNRHPIDLTEVIESSIKLLKHQERGNNIEFKFAAKEGIPAVAADERQIQQTVIALSTNGIDAMPEGGTLTFRLFTEKKQAVIEIEDTGIGIEPEHMSKIFEPFFSTKEGGKGTGLGLTVCYETITDHGGRLAVRSKINKGTTFTIYLPINEEE